MARLKTSSCKPLPDEPSLSELSDEDLLDAWVRDHHCDSLACLIQRYSMMVLNVCRRRCRTHWDADDAFQSTFFFLAHNAHKIRHPNRLAGWLHLVAQRTATASLQQREREIPEMDSLEASTEEPLIRITQQHEAIALDEELTQLPERYRTALVLHWCQGWPLQKVADHLGISHGTVRGQLQRGKKMLGKRLRRRGIAPVVAIAAAIASSATPADAQEATEKLLELTQTSNIPKPTLDHPFLDPLLKPGVKLMPTATMTGGLIAAATLAAMLITTHGENGNAQNVMSIKGPDQSTIAAQFAIGADAAGHTSPINRHRFNLQLPSPILILGETPSSPLHLRPTPSHQPASWPIESMATSMNRPKDSKWTEMYNQPWNG